MPSRRAPTAIHRSVKSDSRISRNAWRSSWSPSSISFNSLLKRVVALVRALFDRRQPVAEDREALLDFGAEIVDVHLTAPYPRSTARRSPPRGHRDLSRVLPSRRLIVAIPRQQRGGPTAVGANLPDHHSDTDRLEQPTGYGEDDRQGTETHRLSFPGAPDESVSPTVSRTPALPTEPSATTRTNRNLGESAATHRR